MAPLWDMHDACLDASRWLHPVEGLFVTPRVVFQSLVTNGYPRVDLFNILANPYTTTQPPVTIGERQLLGLLVEGRTNAEIAAELETTPESVAQSLAAMYVRIGANSRAEATVMALSGRV